MIKNIKIKIKQIQRLIIDLIDGTYFLFSKKEINQFHFTHSIELTQEIKPSQTYEQKVYNLTLAAKEINFHVLLPNEIFSFWQAIGNPNIHYKKSRTITNGEISEDSGGGLCQISGMIYHMSLISGLTIIERYNHSIDLYADETRFTPLGTDAAVVYGYKDLRVQNSFAFPIQFKINLNHHTIQITLISTEKIVERKLNFEILDQNDSITVSVISDHQERFNVSTYKKLINLPLS